MLSRLSALPATRRGKWITLLAWALVIVALAPFGLRLEEAQTNTPETFLPEDSDSVMAIAVERELGDGDEASAVIVYHRPAGLRPAEVSEPLRDRARLERRFDDRVLLAASPLFSADRTTIVSPLLLDERPRSDELATLVGEVRELVSGERDGLLVNVSGEAGFEADAEEVFGSVNGRLLLGTALVVFLLLIVIYRSPIFWIIPLATVAIAELMARGVTYGAAEAGLVTINGQSAGILVVLVFGVGTDYALLLVARYREELRGEADHHVALARAVGHSAPAIAASGATNAAGLLVLSLASVSGTAGIGQAGAIGIAVTAVTMLTLFPALLALAGRRVFWPLVPAVDPSPTTPGIFGRLGAAIDRRPRRIWVGTAAVLLVMAAGSLTLDDRLSGRDEFRAEVESLVGQRHIEVGFPPGVAGPAVVIIRGAQFQTQLAEIVYASDVVAQIPAPVTDVESVVLRPELKVDPYGADARAAIEQLRGELAAVGAPPEAALVGGPSAEERDLRAATSRDNRLLFPLVLAVVALILLALLRAALAAAIALVSVVLSYLAALGASALFFAAIGMPGESPGLPLFGFVFLVALGVDYNIFLLARARQETAARGHREGMLVALRTTGGVITAAGIVLAATFAVLIPLPLTSLVQIGTLVAFGVLLDTFVVRSILVPAMMLDAGERAWWPRGPIAPAED